MRGALTLASLAVLGIVAISYAQTPDSTGSPGVGAQTSPEPQRPRPRRARRSREQTGTIVTLPGFQMLPDGQSRFHCIVHGSVTPTESRSHRRFEVLVRNARLGLSNDRRPMETRFFETPVLRTYLARRGRDVVMVFDMRADATGTLRTEPREGGGTLIIVDFPAGQFMSEEDRRTLREQAIEPTMEVPLSDADPGTTSLSAVGTSPRPAPSANPSASGGSIATDPDTGAAPSTQSQTPQRRTPTTRTRYDPSLDSLNDERPPILNR